MQVNLHGSFCIPGVFLYCFGYRKKSKFSTKSLRKYAILTPKSQKLFWGGGTFLVGRGIFPPHTPPPWRLRRFDSARAFGARPSPQLQLLDLFMEFTVVNG